MSAFTALVRKPGLSFPKPCRDIQRKAVSILLPLSANMKLCKSSPASQVNVEHLPSQDQLADATFVEDTAIVLEDKFLLCPMKELSRQTEVQSNCRCTENIPGLHRLWILLQPSMVVM